jgi:hypothetical protein
MQTFLNFNANQNINNNNTINHMYTYPSGPTADNTTPFGPHLIYDMNLIRHQLACPNLNELQVLSMARVAILHGYMQQDKLLLNNQYCHKFIHQNMIFVLSEAFDVVISIIWAKNVQIIVDNQTLRSSAFPLLPPQPNYTAPPVANIQQTNPQNEFDCMINEQCIDEIVNYLIETDIDLEADTISHDNLYPPLPPATATTTNTYIHDNHSNYNSPQTPQPQPQPRALLPLHTQTSFYSTNTDTATANHQMDGISLTSLYDKCGEERDADASLDIDIDNIVICDELYSRICVRFNGHFQSKQELINLITTAIYVKKVPMQRISAGEEHENEQFCMFVDSFYVYATQQIHGHGGDSYTLCDVFDYTSFQNNYAQYIAALMNNKYNNTRVRVAAFRGSKLIKNSSKRSIISTSSCNTSNKSVRTVRKSNFKKEYHTIYLKPIMERMKLICGQSVDTAYIVEIVDKSIKQGVKRQISKRTFEFKYQSYTIIMSKSLKTILDVTLSPENDHDIITVHPDVVSIISKKYPILDYFTIQKLANQAKLTKTFTTKKNDYRQQFIYDFCGCRIVFASNHTTIVEMQCNDPKSLNLQ